MVDLKRLRAAIAVAALVLATPSAVLGHGGEDHGAHAVAVAAPPPSSGHPRFAAEGDSFQAVLVPEDGRTVLYLADVDTNAPVLGAVIEAGAGDWQGLAQVGGAAGVYDLAWAPGPTGADVTLMVSAGGKDDLVLVTAVRPREATPAAPVTGETSFTWWKPDWSVIETIDQRILMAAGGAGALVMLVTTAVLVRRRWTSRTLVALFLLGGATSASAHGGEDHGAPPSPQPPAAPGAPIVMPKPTQFLLGVRTERIEAREAADTIRVVGRVVPDPSGYARVQPSQPARIVADPAFPIPVPGQAVTRGQVLAVLEPTLSMLEKGDKRAALYRVESELAITERDLARLETLGTLVPARQVETTRIRLDQLRKEKVQVGGIALGRELLMAPVDGLVTDVHVVPGEVVTPERVLVEIVNPSRLRVEAVIHDFTAARRISAATAATKLVPDQTFPLTLLGRSPKIDPADQGIHAIFQVAPAQAEFLSLGMPVDVFLATGTTHLRSAVPREAVTEAGGRQVVFVRTAPEVFEVRPIRINRTIGPLVEVADGVGPGDRVVTQGVEQIRAGR
ncbi:MAG: efflux RND transporter periplasmic adaptor subunit [Alphaproteobacteria bacterium]